MNRYSSNPRYKGEHEQMTHSHEKLSGNFILINGKNVGMNIIMREYGFRG